MFGGNYAPLNWALCDGQLLPISQYSPLYSLIGTTYGGDGVTNFALPNLQSRIPLHTSPAYPMGAKAGVETVTLTPQQIPAHTHVPQANSVGALTTPGNNFWANSTANQFTTGAPTGVMNAGAVSSAGNSQPHDNMVPFQVVNFIIALVGIFPTQN
jgi:microcystin-dependent protein